MKDAFRRVAEWSSTALGDPRTFIGFLVLLAIWAATGPYFHFSTNWQLVINSSTTIATTAAVILIQSSTNRSTRAIQTKLDELIRASEARNRIIDAEDLPDETLDQLITEIREAKEYPS